MSYSTLKEFCDEITQARVAKKLTLQKLTGSLKIRIDYLEAIEAAEFDKLPEGYERIFLKTYLKQLDLDTEEFLAHADRLYFKLNNNDDDSNFKSTPSIDLSQFKSIITWAPVVLVLGVLVYFVISNFSEEEEITPVKEITIEQAKETIDTVIAPIIVKDSVIIDSLTLKIELVESEFFYIKIDSIYEVKKTGLRGKIYTYKAADHFNVYVADGNNTRIFLDDSLVQGRTKKDYRINHLYLSTNGVEHRSITKIELENVEENDTTRVVTDSLSAQ